MHLGNHPGPHPRVHAEEARLATDEAGHYRRVGREFATHGVVRHGRDEYVVGEVHTNTIEGYFSVFKRGMKGPISTAEGGTCTAISPSSISDITTAFGWA